MKSFVKLMLAFLLAMAAVTAVAKPPMTETQKIEALIDSIQQIKGAVFIRNGSEYSADQAIHHLRMKWDSAGSRVKTAQDFIKYCASESSFSGKKYQIRFPDGKVEDSEDYFNEQLRKMSPQPLPVASH
jgi:hypothetical protein